MIFPLSNSERKRLLTPIKKTILQYKMIEEGDRVAVGLSGGKDSSTLLYLLTIIREQLPFQFELVPISLSLGFEEFDISPLKRFVKELGHELFIKETNISQIVFDYKQEKNPCSLCANLRRGILFEYAASLNCNKLAYGHHLDDGIETFFMNLFYGGKLGVFKPKTYMDRSNITLIRPMLAIEEKTIINFVQAKQIPVIHNPCPADKHTKREEMKDLVKTLSTKYPDLRQKFMHGAMNVREEDFWRMEEKPRF
ncbi:tRNA lysidine(34) synthetase [Bacillus benzoevorans]|uniref:tRNA(Ile)-lysidine synthase TilS/MesJ n=1 Tax=Bacillus benzoevorans TaxID=1456 RepID=A0A7X0HVV2_9BACI|nr:ATP-binding protein [Bacillus benzoevorans]MBB6447804.1 tRNA(Ile)-lysidine synthase TilS/MesJ [Bacillus benzoevorans]